MSDAVERPAPSPPTDLRLQVESDPRINWAMERNGIPIVHLVRVTNNGRTTRDDLTLTLQVAPDFGPRCEVDLACLPPGVTVTIEQPDVRLDGERLRSLIERERAELLLEIRSRDEILAKEACPVEVLAFNEWNRTALPELLAAFVLPNHPAVATTLEIARDLLEERHGTAGIAGYQTGGRAAVRAQIEAVYEAIQQLQITYVSPPASFETTGQKIRLPDQVLEHRMATCLDLTVLAAACLEACGLHPVMILGERHALPACWLDDDWLPVAATDEHRTLKRLLEAGEIVVFDSSHLTERPPSSFEEAEEAAHAHLDDAKSFEHLVDIRSARLARLLPLPLGPAALSVPGPAPALDPGPGLPQHPVTGGSDDPARVDSTVDSPAVAPAPAIGTDLENEEARVETPASRIDRWKERLLDLTLRNRLLNFRVTRKTIALDLPEIHELEDRLAAGARLTLHPQVTIEGTDPRQAELLAARGADELLHEQRLALLKHGQVITRHATGDLARRLLEIYRQARTELEESGATTLYLAIGMLRWYEEENTGRKSEGPARLAPILLYPVEIVRQSARERFKVRLSDDEPRLNDTLFEKLRVSFGLEFGELDHLPADEAGIDVARVLDIVRRGVARMAGFEALSESYLGFFSFTKFLMWRDLHEYHEELSRNRLVAHLVHGGLEPWPGTAEIPDPRDLDRLTPPGRTPLVLDADSSQQVAVEAALAGASFVLQGPPGTGKSQTIANIIGACLERGRRVLFVAEKRAALDVVARRLRRVELGDACLELHSNKASKRAVIAELARVLDARADPAGTRNPDGVGAVCDEVERLDAYAEAMHRRTPLGCSFFESVGRLGELERLAVPQIELPLAGVTETKAGTHAARLESLAALAEAASDLESIESHPFAACGSGEWTMLRERQWQGGIEELDRAAANYFAVIEEVVHLLGLPEQPPLAGVTSLLEMLLLLSEGLPPHAAALCARDDAAPVIERLTALCKPARERARLLDGLQVFLEPGILEQEIDPWLGVYRRFARSFPPVRWFGLRRARAELAPFMPDPKVSAVRVLQALERASDAREQIEQLKHEAEIIGEVFGTGQDAGTIDATALEATVSFARRWIEASERLHELGAFEQRPAPPQCSNGAAGELHETLGEAYTALRGRLEQITASLRIDHTRAFGSASEGFQVGAIRERCRIWLASMGKLRGWARFVAAEEKAGALGLEALCDALRESRAAPADLAPAYQRAFLREWVDHMSEEVEALRGFNGREHDRLVERFRRDDAALIAAGGRRVHNTVAANIPEPSNTNVPASEVGILQREARKKRRHMALRRLLEQIPNLLGRLKPCFLMSPLSIAQYLPPAAAAFDLVIFDEASQIPTHDAIGAIARGRQVIVVGDSRQLPPTTFFDVALDDEMSPGSAADSELVHELESILDECLASRVPAMMLRWHYRSRDERLIAFSNMKYYENRLYTFPAARADVPSLGVRFEPVEGVFDRGHSRRNRTEAVAVARWATRHLLDPEQRYRSVGVVTFNQAQQMLVEDLLDDARRAHPEIEPFFSDRVPEPVMVKNLENVQGDERDVMLFSITYGPDATGKLSMNFGPLNREGGERRLNVAITRAREQLVVFSSLRPEMIDLGRTRALGAAHLKEFLRYAAEGPSALGMNAGSAVTSSDNTSRLTPLEKSIQERLEARGHELETEVGCGGYRVDLAIRDRHQPGVYRLGVECDGATYASADTARDRDRLRHAVLESLGWSLVRVWSPDWWHDDEHEVARIERALHEAEMAGTGGMAPGANAGVEIEEPAPEGGEDRAASVPGEDVAPGGEGRTNDPPQRPASQPLASAAARDVEAPPSRESPAQGIQPYRPFIPPPTGDAEAFKEAEADATLIDLAEAVARAEGPVHREILYRRLMAAYGIARLGRHVDERLEKITAEAERAGKIRLAGDFVWPTNLDPGEPVAPRGPMPSGEVREIDHVPPEEIESVLISVLESQIALPAPDLIRAAAHILGYRRLSHRIRRACRTTIKALVQQERCVLTDETVRLA